MNEYKKQRYKKIIRHILRSKMLMIGGLIFLILLIVSFIGPALTQYNPTQITPNMLSSPSAEHFFGTDDFGRDLFTRTVMGARTSLTIGLFAAIISGLLGAFIGLLSGYYKYLDNIFMRLMDVIMAFPEILLALGIIAALGAATYNILVALSIVYTPRVARVVRASTLSVSEEDYIEAIKSLGANPARIIIFHILPNIFAPLIVQVSFIFAWAVLAEAGLGFIGVGIQPPIPSLGNILADARPLMRSAPWMTFFPAGTLFFLVMSINLVGDGLRELLDPKTKYYN